jgi:FtsP/CotA-like multicopper oxidase with cupredoxin domain
MWGYAEDPNQMQYPGPTMIVDEDVPITINLTNTLPVPVSIVFPGQTGVTAAGGSPGLLTSEADPNGGTVSYSFTPTEPGTYMYNSGTNPELQVEMGLVGALIVRPTGAPGQAYAHADSAFDRETLFLFTEIDPNIHDLVAQGNIDQVDNTTWFPVYWFINGRCAMDTLTPAFTPLLPRQPYNCLPRMHPGEKLLLRVVSAGRDLHPLHTHGNNFDFIARDGRLLQSAQGAGTDLSFSDYTISVRAGGTADALFGWTGKKLGWDIYGHDPNDPLEPGEYAPDHGKPFPVLLPPQQDLTFGGLWSGSPFLGAMGALPPGEGGNNPNAGFTFMWHSHAEKELCNNDIFPGGLMTILIIEAPSVAIVE